MMTKVLYLAIVLVQPRFTWESTACSDFLGHPNCHLLPGDGDCGRANYQYGPRIVGGEDTRPWEYPWVAQLYHRKDNVLHWILNLFGRRKEEWLFSCGGSLISKNYVVSSAHCYSSFKKYVVRLGQYNRKSDERTQDILVETFITHPKHNRPKGQNDIALLRLQNPARIDGYVKPICLPISPVIQSGEFENLPFKVAGFGVYKMNKQKHHYPAIMQKVTLKSLPIVACSAMYYDHHQLIVGPKQLCTSGDGGHDTCNGDSGGPLMTAVKDSQGHRKYFLTGVVSFGDKICGQGLPCVYAKVSEYLNWILDNMKP